MRTKTFFIFWLILFSTGWCGAQNLVPNPSFEEYTECPDFTGQVWRANGWYIAENSPDYFHPCCNTTFPVCGVPNNDFGVRNAATGIAYCGFATYELYPPPEYKEKIGIELTSPTIIGVRYYVSMKVSSVNAHHNQVVNGANNKLGLLFSTFKYDVNNLSPNNNFSQFYSDSIVTDTVGWTEIKGSFIADSAYTFITAGSFFDIFHTDTIRYWYISGNNELVAYYFVDDICVSSDSMYCATWTDIQAQVSDGNIIATYPNPAGVSVTIDNIPWDCHEIEIFNVEGKLMQSTAVYRSTKVTMDISELPLGIYSVIVKTEKEIKTKRFVKASY